MKIISGGVTAPKGFYAGGVHCSIKPGSTKKDLALIYSETDCAAAAVFTTNRVKAACVTVTQENTEDGTLRAIIANSGNANACTGEAGLKAARRMAQLAADMLVINPQNVAVASTGVIGVPLPIEVIEKNINELKSCLNNNVSGHDAALEAIMTTDTRKKDIAVEFEINGKPVRIGAMTKGSGMIHPNMATMLAFITTDAAILPSALNTALKQAVKKSFNRLTVDGDTSTNDMAIILANGLSMHNAQCTMHNCNEQLAINNEELGIRNENYRIFCEALEFVCVELAKMMARDGEGATKLVTVKVTGASCEDAAEALAKSAASSSLVKAACFGADANWGRVLCAMGYSGAEFSQEKVNVSFASRAGSVLVCKNGCSVEFSEERAKLILSEEEVDIVIELSDGDGSAEAWGCDLSYDYVKINGDYRS